MFYEELMVIILGFWTGLTAPRALEEHYELFAFLFDSFEALLNKMPHFMRKPAFSICENKDVAVTVQLISTFVFTKKILTILLLSMSEI